MKTLTWQKPGQQNVAQELIKIIINYVAELRYTIFWITFLIFIPLGHFLKPDFYIIDPHTLITNFLAIQYNYNHEWWFLFPYFLLVLSFRFFIHIITHSTYKNNIILIIFLTILHFTHGYIISKLGPFYIKHIVSGYLVCIYPFTLGIIFSYYDLFNKSKQYLSSHIPTHKNTILRITLIVHVSYTHLTLQTN